MSSDKFDFYFESGLYGILAKVVRFCSQPLNLWFQVRILSPEIFGALVLSKVIVNTTTEIAGLGLNNLIIHRVPKLLDNNGDQKPRKFVGQIIFIGVASVLLSVMLLVIGRDYFQVFFGAERLSTCVFWLALMAPLATLRDFHGVWLTSHERMIEGYFLTGIIPNSTLLIGFGAVWWFDYGLYAVLVVIFLERIIGLIPWLVSEKLFLELNLNTLTKNDLVYSTQLLGNRLVTLMNINLDILMVGWLGSPSSTAIYKIGSSIAGAIRQVHGLTQSIFKPRLSRYLGAEQYDKLRREFTVLQKINVTALLFLLIGLIPLGIPFLSLFGETYVASYSIVLIIFLGRVFQLSYGEIGGVLILSGYSGWAWLNNSIVFLLNITGNYFLIQWIGVEGAAWAWAGSIALSQTLVVIEVKALKELLFLPYDVVIAVFVLISSVLWVLSPVNYTLAPLVALVPLSIYFSGTIYPKVKTLIQSGLEN